MNRKPFLANAHFISIDQSHMIRCWPLICLQFSSFFSFWINVIVICFNKVLSTFGFFFLIQCSSTLFSSSHFPFCFQTHQCKLWSGMNVLLFIVTNSVLRNSFNLSNDSISIYYTTFNSEWEYLSFNCFIRFVIRIFCLSFSIDYYHFM